MRLSDSLSSSPSRVGVIALGVLLLAVALALGTSQVGAQVTPPSTPTYTATIIDCVTGNNQFYISSEQKYHWYVNNTLTTDDGAGSNTGVGCDSYQNDRYERPIGQTLLSYDDIIVPGPGNNPAANMSGLLPDTQFAPGADDVPGSGGTFYEFVDITRGFTGYDATFMYFRIELYGPDTVSDSLSRSAEFGNGTYYSVRLANNVSANAANNGIMLRNHQETANTNSASWTTTNAFVFRDLNGDVSCTAVNRTRSDGELTVPPCSITGNNGYTDSINNSYLYIRKNVQTFTGPGGSFNRPYVEFAFNYVKYNQERGTNFLPTNITYLELDATRGLKDNGNYLWNDEYEASQAGSPYVVGSQNIYELDTLTGSISVTQPTNTPTHTPTNTPVLPTATATSTPTNTPEVPTATATSTPTNTPEVPTATATSTPTNTPVVPTATATDTPTNTPAPPTATPTNTPTNTPAPPTATPTNTPVPNACPAGAAGYSYTSMVGTGLGSETINRNGARVDIPNNQNVIELYAQLAGKRSGPWNYARFIRPNGTYINDKTLESPAYRQNAVFWYGQQLTPTTLPYWKARLMGAPTTRPFVQRAFVLYPTYSTAQQYVDMVDYFENSAQNHVYWQWIPVQVQSVALPAPLTTVDLVVRVALVDNDPDARPVDLTIEAGGVSQTVTQTDSTHGPLLSIIEVTLENVPAGTSQVVLTLESPMNIGDSVAMIGMTANYICTP